MIWRICDQTTSQNQAKHVPCDLRSTKLRLARGHQADSLSGKGSPPLEDNGCVVFDRRGPFLHWESISYRTEEFQKFPHHPKNWCQAIWLFAIQEICCLHIQVIPCVHPFSFICLQMCEWFVQILLYFLFSVVSLCYMTWFTAHLCLQLPWWSRDLFSLVSVCLQRVECVCACVWLVSLCEDSLLTDELPCTTLVIQMCW